MNNNGRAVAGEGTLIPSPSRRTDRGVGGIDPRVDADCGGRNASAESGGNGDQEDQQQDLLHDTPLTAAPAGRSVTGRIRGARLTEEGEKSFEELWSAARPGVERVLRARGVYGADQDDVVQEVALRAYSAWSRQKIASSFSGWCAGTARHVSADLWRHAPNEPLTPAVLDLPSSSSTEELVEGSLSLVGFSRAWKSLTAIEQQTLLRPAPEDATPAERNRFYVSLHRLRTRTRERAESFTPAVVGWLGRVREVLSPGVLDGAAAAAVAAAVAATGLIGSPSPLPTRSPGDRGVAPVSVRSRPVPPRPAPPADGKMDHLPPTITRRSPTVHTPVERRVDVALPDRSGYVRVRNDDEPSRPPLWCGDVTGLVSRVCIDYPVRP